MRSVVAVSLLLALPAGGCAYPTYENPPLQTKVDRLWKERDDCLLANAPQVDDRTSDVRRLARRVAAACATQTTRLMDMAIPEPDQKARDAFQAEAERRAAYILVTFRQVGAATPQPQLPSSDVGAPAPLQ
jgi:hypothetical protein